MNTLDSILQLLMMIGVFISLLLAGGTIALVFECATNETTGCDHEKTVISTSD